MARQQWPKPPPWLSLSVEPRIVARGQELRVRVGATTEGRPSGELEYGLVCVATAAATHRTWDGDAPGQFRFDKQGYAAAEWHPLPDGDEERTLLVPPEGPYSYGGELLAYGWGVAVRPVGRVSGGILAWVPVDVGP